MNIDDMTIKQAREIARLFCDQPQTSSATACDMVGHRVIVRAVNAGAVYGTLASLDGDTAVVRDARQMWHWTAKQGGTLIDCATHGVKGGKFSAVSDSVTVLGACAIISVSTDAENSLDDASWG